MAASEGPSHPALVGHEFNLIKDAAGDRVPHFCPTLEVAGDRAQSKAMTMKIRRQDSMAMGNDGGRIAAVDRVERSGTGSLGP
jgi:hypothetical protein